MRVVCINNILTPNLDTFIETMKILLDGTRVPLRFYSISNIHKEQVTIIMWIDVGTNFE